MNIFVLDTDPRQAAEDQCDRHITKMVLESAQLLCSAFEQGSAPYKRTHYNHPCAVWTRETGANFMWLAEHGLSLAEEYSFRYGREHASKKVIYWCIDNFILSGVDHSGERTPFAQAMPEQFRIENDPVAAYRAYYLGSKSRFAQWNKTRSPPYWWTAAAS